MQRCVNEVLVRLKTRSVSQAVHVELATEGITLVGGVFDEEMLGLLNLVSNSGATINLVGGLVAKTSMQYVNVSCSL